jgi:hypothetical protein
MNKFLPFAADPGPEKLMMQLRVHDVTTQDLLQLGEILVHYVVSHFYLVISLRKGLHPENSMQFWGFV